MYLQTLWGGPPFLARWLSVPMAGTFQCQPVSGCRCVASSASGSWGRRGAGRRRRCSIFQRSFGAGPCPYQQVRCCPPHVRAPYLSRMEATYEGSVRCTRSLCTCPLRPPAFDFICVFAGQVYRNARVCYVAVDKSRRLRASPSPQLWRGSELWAAFVIRPPPWVSRITPSCQAPSRG